MRLAASLSAAVVVAAFWPAPPATSVGATCEGQAATIVGTDGQPVVTGTEGPDVVVSGGAEAVAALGGDDLVCVTGDTSEVDAGPGDDVVTAREPAGTSLSRFVRAELGDGADSYFGGRGRDEVFAGDLVPPGFQLDDDPDTVRTSSGDDSVWTGETETTNDDVVVMSWGGRVLPRAVFFWGRQGPSGRLSFGEGPVALHVGDASTGDPHWVIDNRERRISAGTPWLAWTGDVSEFDLEPREVPGGSVVRVTFLGTRRAETLRLGGEVDRFDARFGKGGDLALLRECGTFPGSLLGLGPGRDTVRNGCDELVVRLDRGRVQPGVEVRGLETLEVSGDDVTVWGDEGRNRVELRGCGGTMRGGAGADALRVVRRLCGGPGATIFGGRGDDLLSGSPYADRLIGDRGHDVVDGKAGSDLCRAEVRFSCERR